MISEATRKQVDRLHDTVAAGVAPSTPAVRIDGEQMRVRFDRFTIDAYPLFLRVKGLPEYHVEFDPDSETYEVSAPARFAALLGVESPPAEQAALPLWEALYDDQKRIVQMAIQAKRYATWLDCGLGKTYIEAEWARQVSHLSGGGRVLGFTFNEIVPQWMEMVRDFYQGQLAVVRLDTREHMREWCRHGTVDGRASDAKIGLTNYEKLNHRDAGDQVVNEMRYLAGIFADESNRLSGGGGKQKWALIKSSRGIPYKLSATATPAPNAVIEFASQASFLETMRAGNEIIWSFFRRDERTQEWTVRKYARADFFRWMATWSIYVRDPRRYGWRLDAPQVPPPVILPQAVQPTDQQQELARRVEGPDEYGNLTLFRKNAANTIDRNKLAQIARGFMYRTVEDGAAGKARRTAVRIDSRKPPLVADLAAAELAAGNPTLVWTVYDEESTILAELLAQRGVAFELLTGKTKEADRLAILERFRHGQTTCLISRACMLGFGMNFQHCRAMVFSGFNDSYVAFYQALRRAYRPGQTHSLRVHIPYIELLEGDSWNTILHKRDRNEQDIADMEASYIEATAEMRRRGTETQRGEEP